jgi:polyketide cyclase/dehydrase/lipid transport protein
MVKTLAVVTCAASLALTAPATALELSKSVDVPIPAAAAWKAIGDFCGIATWHPAVSKCEPSTTDGTVTRLLTLKDGGEVLEKQLSFDDKAMAYSYTIIDAGPLPVAHYQSTMSVKPRGAGSTITWWGKFESKGDDAKSIDAISGVYQGGLDNLASKAK